MGSYTPVATAPRNAPSAEKRPGWFAAGLAGPVSGLTEEGRSRERYRRAFLTFLSSAGSKGVTVLTTALSVPLAIRYLGPERYGLWMAISSAIVMLNFTDFGLGNGLLNAVAGTTGQNGRQALRKYVSSAFFLLAGIAALLSVGFAASYSHIGWAHLFNAKSALAAAESGPTCAVFFACFAIALPLGTVQKVQLGLQEGFRSNLWQTAGSVLALAGLLLAIGGHAGLPWLIGAVAGLPVLVLSANWFTEFRCSRPWLFPQIRRFDPAAAGWLARRGSLFFCSQLGAALATQAPVLLILRIFGPASVPEYAVAYRVIAVLLLANSLLLAPLWPAYAEALAIRDSAWVRRTFAKTLKIALLISGLGGAGFLLTYRSLITLWVNAQVTPTALTAFALAAFAVCNGIRYASSMCLNGCNQLLGQAIYQLPAAALSVLLAFFLAPRHGVGGVALAFAIGEAAIALCQLAEVFWFFRRFERKLQ